MREMETVREKSMGWVVFSFHSGGFYGSSTYYQCLDDSHTLL